VSHVCDKVCRPVTPARCRGLTLIEVLVVMAVITMLFGVLVPGLAHSRRIAKQTGCLANLQQIGVAICTYAMENGGSIPYGPKAPPPSATNFYPKTGNVTSLISLESGAPAGLGLMLDSNLARAPDSLFCPGADEPEDTQHALARVGKSQVESSYYYRHASVTTLSGSAPPPKVKLDLLGKNRRGAPIRCLVMDTQFIAPPSMHMFNIYTRTHHQQRVVNALYTDGHAETHQNKDDQYLVNLSVSVYNTLERILSIFEELDSK
jgi:prepilin-type N-terminal cleavage/methylation domain-containing protein/prepilin-type processing-associated H-X9-DG protein